MKKILSIGGATQDIFILHDEPHRLVMQSRQSKTSYILFKEGIKIDVPDLHYASGGGATNACVSFKRLGLDAHVVSKIAHDAAGEFVLNELKKEGISSDFIIVSNSGSTGISFIIPTLENNYTALCYRAINRELQLHDIPLEALKTCNTVYVTALTGNSAKLLPILASKANELGVCVATNPGTAQYLKYPETVYDALKHIDILILNAFEAEICLRGLLNSTTRKKLQIPSSIGSPGLLEFFMMHQDEPYTLYHFFDEIMELGPKTVVVTHGAQGVYVAQDKRVFYHPSLPVQVINTVGAGDAFGSAFVGCLTLGKTLQESLILALLNSTSVIEHLDAKKGLLSFDELEKRFKTLGTSKLVEYKF